MNERMGACFFMLSKRKKYLLNGLFNPGGSAYNMF